MAVSTLPAIIISSVSNTTSIWERKIMFYSKSRKLWIEHIRLSDGKRRDLTAKTEKELRQKLIAYDPNAKPPRLFSDAADEWEKANTERVEHNTASAYAAHVRRAKESFAGKDISEITPDMVQAYITGLAEADLAKDTVRRALVVVNRIFKYEMVRPGSGVRYNPCAAVEIPRGLKKGKREPPTEEQLAKVTPDGDMGLFAYFMRFTGLRNGELLALRWEDIDRDNMVIHVNKAVEYLGNNPHVKERTKTEAGMRDVPLLNALVSVLPKKKHGYVFGGSRPMTKYEFRSAWTRFCRDHGLAEEIKTVHYAKGNKHTYTSTRYKPLVTPYQFRHEYASLLEDAGVAEFDAKTALGHSSIMVTKDVYTHIREKKHQSRLADKVNSYLANDKE